MIHTQVTSASERAFLGAVINGDTHAGEHGLQREDFTNDLLQRIFSTCLMLEAQGKPADLVTLSDADSGIDAGFLIDLSQEATPLGSFVDQYAQNIRAAAQRRKVISLFAGSIQEAKDGLIPLDETVSKARAELDRISAQTATGETMTGEDAICDLLLWLDKGDADKPIRTGLSRLDEKLTGGFRGSKLIIVGARPSVGKSALLSFFAVNALKDGRRVLYISREMAEREIVGRMISTLSGVSQGKMEGRTLSDGDYEAIFKSQMLLRANDFWISTKAGTPAAIRRAALRMKAAGGIDLVLVDYLQLLQTDAKVSNRAEAVGEISRALKLLAMELGIPVIAAAQVNRASTQGEDREPKLSELRESGSIEQDADIVFLLHASLNDQDQRGLRSVELIVAKNRQGRLGRTTLKFDGALMRFMQIEDRYQEVS